MKKIFLICFVFSEMLLKSQMGAYYQQHADYIMDINVDVEKYQYKGKQTLTYTNNSPDTLNVFYFHLYWNAFQPKSLMDERLKNFGKGSDKRMVYKDGFSKIAGLKPDEIGYQKINMLKQNGKEVTFKTDGTILEVKLSQPILPGAKSVFEMEWDAQLPMQIRRAGRNNSEGIDMTMTQWYPKAVEYDYDGWHTFDYIGREFHGVFANFDVTINIDKDYIIGAGGTLVNPLEVKGYAPKAKQVIKKGRTSWHFIAENIHDFAWAADPDYTVEKFQVLGGPLVYYVYQKSDKTKSWEDSKFYIEKYFQIMKEHFGAYPYPSYSFIQGGDGGMEYGMCTMILGNAASVEKLCGLMIHEASHSWFQQVVATNESTRAWMDEGFTSYAENKAMGILFPYLIKDYPNPHYDAVRAYMSFAKSGNEEPMGIFADHFKTNAAYSVAAYIKGEMFLVQLGYIVGEQNLAKIMKEYYKTWKFKHPTDRDFLHIAQKVSNTDLKWYWNYMTYTTRQIDYAVKDVVSVNNKETRIDLENIGDFPMPVDVYVEYIDGTVQIYNIPLNMMRSFKPQEFTISQIVLEPWKWTKKEYSFNIPVSRDKIKQVNIDITQRLGDVDNKNNNYTIK